MPKKIVIYEVDYLKETQPQTQLAPEIKGFIAFAYPGFFVGVGETRDEAMVLAKLRLRTSRLKHTEDWVKWAQKREENIKHLFETKGISREHAWEEGTLEKKD